MALTVHRGEDYEYRDDDGTGYFSVSQVLHVLDADLYRHADPDALKAASLRGQRVHLLYALLLGASVGLVPAPDRPEGEIGGYYDAIVRFLQEHKPVPVRIEEPSAWVNTRVAGTPDSLVRINERATDASSSNALTVVEVKTTDAMLRLHRVQVQVYGRLEAYREARNLRLLYLRPDGTYRYEHVDPSPYDVAAFLSAVSVLTWRRRRE